MEPTHVSYKELPIDENNIFTANISEKNQVQNILFRKSKEYAVTGLAINQNTDNLNEVTDKNSKRILQELIESLLKEEKDDEHAYSLKLHNSKGYEKVIPLTKLPPLKFKYFSLQTKKTEEINFYNYHDHLEKFGFEWEIVGSAVGISETLEFKYTIAFSPDKKKLVKKIIMSKGMRNTFFISESRIWNFSTKTINAVNSRSHLLHYMTDEDLIKEFWKMSDKVPIRVFSKEILVHKNNFIRFVDKKLNTKGNAVLCTGNVQFETIIQPLFENRSYLFKSMVNYLGVPKYYHERRDTNFLRYSDIFKVKKTFSGDYYLPL